VSIAVAPEHRGRGLGTAILEALNAEAGRDGAIRRLRALVHPENPASLRAFTRAGYQARQNPEHGFLVLERGIGAHE
jgi:RimJ/RimL family protein N-acetyltransferase